MGDVTLKCEKCGAVLTIATDDAKTLDKAKKAFERRHKGKKCKS